MDDPETHTVAPQHPEATIVRFETCTGDGVDVAVHVAMQNPVLKMLYQYTCTTYPPVIHVDDDTQVFHNLIRRLEGGLVPLQEKDMAVVLLQLRCAHKYQYYLFATEILQILVAMCRSHNVLHLYSLLSGLPELPSIEDSTAPSAPPIVDLQQSDPEQAAFSDALLHAYQHCLQLIDTRSADVLASDALLSVPAESLCQLTRRDTISARELEVGRALLRWTRHHTLNFGLTESLRRRVVLGSLRLLTMTVKDLRRLELERYGVLSREELGAVLDFVLHGSGDLPESLDEHRDLWLQKRTGPKELRRRRGILHRLTTGSRVKSGPPWLTDSRMDAPAVRRVHFEGQDDTDAAERREATLERRHRRTEKLKMALATGASILFD